jgi:hypothetical protein
MDGTALPRSTRHTNSPGFSFVGDRRTVIATSDCRALAWSIAALNEMELESCRMGAVFADSGGARAGIGAKPADDARNGIGAERGESDRVSANRSALVRFDSADSVWGNTTATPAIATIRAISDATLSRLRLKPQLLPSRFANGTIVGKAPARGSGKISGSAENF